MTDEIPALLAEARSWTRDDAVMAPRALRRFARRLADALEAEHQRAESATRTGERILADAVNYRAAIEEAHAPNDDERTSLIDAATDAFEQHDGAPTWQVDPEGRDAALRWHMRGFEDGLAAGFRRSVSPERVNAWLAAHDAEVRDEHDSEVAERLGLLLWHLTGGRLSKSTYDVPTMVTQIEDTFAREQASDVRAGVVAEEPEWEYGLYDPATNDVDTCGTDPVTPESFTGVRWEETGEYIVRRRVAGPWVPVKQGDETDV